MNGKRNTKVWWRRFIVAVWETVLRGRDIWGEPRVDMTELGHVGRGDPGAVAKRAKGKKGG